ncbi:MAG TPA: glycoside hydrolase family 18, partial [bacterium]|nr:glycoside hydrolase family 18 [bacterium]
YDWPASGPAEGISMREALSRAARAGVPVSWDGRTASPYFSAADRVVHFENAQSIGQKVVLAAQYGVGGIAAWRLGHEMPEVWAVLERYLKPNGAGSP